MNANHVTKLDSKVVSGDLVHLDLALLDIIGAQTDENGIMPLLASNRDETGSAYKNTLPSRIQDMHAYLTMIVSPRNS